MRNAFTSKSAVRIGQALREAGYVLATHGSTAYEMRT
jgi:hypothetical protein